MPLQSHFTDVHELLQAVEEAIRSEVDDLREEVASDYVPWDTMNHYVTVEVGPYA